MPIETITFQLVQPDQEDARLLYTWRNDPVTLENSYHSKPQTFEQFWGGFHVKYFSAGLPLLFIMHENRPVGVLSFNDTVHPELKHRRIVEVSINMAPQSRGRGYGTAALTTIQEYLKSLGIDDIYAEVKQENHPSKHLFEKAGFHEINRENKFIDQTGEIIPIVKYIAKLTEVNIWDRHSTFVIAEAGSNWRLGSPQRDLLMAKRLIESAKEVGADAIKFQIYRSKDVYVPNAGKSDYLANTGIREDISLIFDDLAMPYEMIPELQSYAVKHQIEFMATPFSKFDFAAVDPYVKTHKIASYELGHIRLLELAAASQKPLLLSTGAATLHEIEWAVSTYKRLGGKNLALMQCTAQYPASSHAMNLSAITQMRRVFGVPVGLSDHSLDPFAAPLGAVALGACVIEKHFTLGKRLPGPDHPFALEPDQFQKMVKAIRQQEKMVGFGVKYPMKEEEELRGFARRGVQAIRNIEKGESFEEGVNVEILRPGNQMLGIHSKYLDQLQGKPSLNKIPTGQGIQFEDFNHA